MRTRANVALRSWLNRTLLAIVSRLSGRHAVLLPSEASHEEMTIDLRAPYRVEGVRLTIDLKEPGTGQLTATLLEYDNHFPTKTLWRGSGHYPGPSALTLDLNHGVVSLGGQEWGTVGPPLVARRFCWRLALTGTDGTQRARLTGHYVPVRSGTVGSSYFSGTNYVDHEAESAGGHRQIVELLQWHHGRAPVLEVGCATGGLLAELDAAGFLSFGLDFSEWAVGRAGERLGPDRAWVCDVERDPLPASIKTISPFGALVLSSVFEHFNDPFAVLAKITAIAAPDAVLVITTTNAAGLTHALFGTQWEGYFDCTHLGIDRVSVRTLRDELPRLGWRIAQLTTHRVWDGDADPTRATLREWWGADARFRRLLTERDLGDFITCVAMKA
jgi:SAM-dependent methyltransferase